jgi:hypothetical protein
MQSLMLTPDTSQPHRCPGAIGCGVLQRLRDASHYQAQVHPQYKFEGMTDMIKGAFMEDLFELLNSATGDQRCRKTFYEIDTEFEKMTSSLLKNFDRIGSLMPFLRASLRQTMIHKLATVGRTRTVGIS